MLIQTRRSGKHGVIREKSSNLLLPDSNAGTRKHVVITMKPALVIAAVMIAVLIVPSCTGAEGLTAPDIVFSAPGQELASNITLDQALGGISGYHITLSLEPSGIAQITRVEFPEWAVLSQVSTLPAETVRIIAANLQESAVPTSGSVELVRIYAVSSVEGTVIPEIVEAKVDSYAGNTVVSITPTGTIPTVSVSEGGMGSISYTGPDVTGGTAIPTVTTQIAAPTVSPSGESTGGGEGAGSSLSTGTVTTVLTPENVIEAAPSAPTTLPTSSPGPGPVAIVLVGIFAAVLATGWIKRD